MLFSTRYYWLLIIVLKSSIELIIWDTTIWWSHMIILVNNFAINVNISFIIYNSYFGKLCQYQNWISTTIYVLKPEIHMKFLSIFRGGDPSWASTDFSEIKIGRRRSLSLHWYWNFALKFHGTSLCDHLKLRLFVLKICYVLKWFVFVASTNNLQT